MYVLCICYVFVMFKLCMCYVLFILPSYMIMFQLCPVYKFTQILHVSVSLGNIYDSKRSEPGSWMVVGVIPAFSMKKATLAGWEIAGKLECKDQRCEKVTVG